MGGGGNSSSIDNVGNRVAVTHLAARSTTAQDAQEKEEQERKGRSSSLSSSSLRLGPSFVFVFVVDRRGVADQSAESSLDPVP